MAVLTTATLGLTIVAELAMTYIMYVISPGYAHEPQKFSLAVTLTRVTMPYLPFMAVYAHLSGRPERPGPLHLLRLRARRLLNLVMLVAVLGFGRGDARTAAHAAAWGVLVAGLLQAALLWWGVARSGGRVDFRWPRLTPQIKSVDLAGGARARWRRARRRSTSSSPTSSPAR